MIVLETDYITVERFLELYGDTRGIELVNGEIRRLPMAGNDHGYICSNISGILREFVKKHRLGRITSNDSYVRTGVDSLRGSDVSYLSFKTIPASQPLPSVAVPPFELTVEIRSKHDTLTEMASKAEEYLEAGVQVVMLVDPTDNSVIVMRQNQESKRYESKDLLTLADILPGFSVRVTEFFE